MHQIKCPHCGVRDEAEYTYRGDASVVRPAPDAGVDAFSDFVYARANPKGWHVEWWHHAGGCRQWIKVVRHTVTHEIRATATANEMPEVPAS
jgi:methylglutamate dehydrogenase subunit B